MGQLFENPIIQKGSSAGDNDYLLYGVSSMQGYRITMEDRHCSLLDQQVSEGYPLASFFGIFDGHSGQNAAHMLSGSLWAHVRQEEIRRIREETAKGNRPRLFEDDENLEESYLAADADFRHTLEDDLNTAADSSGTTCISCLVVPYEVGGTREVEITCANVGDSRCVLFDKGVVTPLSHDHKPNDDVENARIVAAGGFVEFGRVNGTLALSRAFGDLSYKNHPELSARDQIVVATPTIQRARISFAPAPSAPSSHTFLLLACDGIWDVMTNEVAAQFVEERLIQQENGSYGRMRKNHKTRLYSNPSFKLDKRCLSIFIPQLSPGEFDLGAICEDLIDECVLALDSKDNVSAAIVLFQEKD